MDNLKRILLVDDDAGIVEFLSAALRDEGRIEHASTAEEALAILQHTACDVILTDLKMPGMGGLELLQRAHELRPEARVIVMTGHSEPQAVAESLRRHAFSFLVKPFTVSVLKDAVENALQSTDCFDDIRILSAIPSWIS